MTIQREHSAIVIATALLLSLTIASTAQSETELQLTDQRIGDKIADQLMLDQAVDADKIDVSVSAGIVTLTHRRSCYLDPS